MSEPNVILEAAGIKKYFYSASITGVGFVFTKSISSSYIVKAVDGMNFQLYEGETLALVGESGCGKTTVARCILRLNDLTEGQIIFDGVDISHISRSRFRPIRQKIQMVFQHPETSLNPRWTIRGIVSDPLRQFKISHSSKDIDNRVANLIEKVGLPKDSLDRYPHEMSGGQQQRVGIMRALITSPKVIILDEPTSALDVSVRAQVLKLLQELQKAHDVAYLFISHDLSTVRYISDRVAVMYLGKLVEIGSAADIFTDPLHPYTKALISAVPVPDPAVKKTEKFRLLGELSLDLIKPNTCKLSPRCPFAFNRCKQEEPTLKENTHGHYSACFLYEK
jgi:peptide/nickel transport system ATP-binding protein